LDSFKQIGFEALHFACLSLLMLFWKHIPCCFCFGIFFSNCFMKIVLVNQVFKAVLTGPKYSVLMLDVSLRIMWHWMGTIEVIRLSCFLQRELFGIEIFAHHSLLELMIFHWSFPCRFVNDGRVILLHDLLCFIEGFVFLFYLHICLSKIDGILQIALHSNKIAKLIYIFYWSKS
jgi:hypothetical protein